MAIKGNSSDWINAYNSEYQRLKKFGMSTALTPEEFELWLDYAASNFANNGSGGIQSQEIWKQEILPRIREIELANNYNFNNTSPRAPVTAPNTISSEDRGTMGINGQLIPTDNDTDMMEVEAATPSNAPAATSRSLISTFPSPALEPNWDTLDQVIGIGGNAYSNAIDILSNVPQSKGVDDVIADKPETTTTANTTAPATTTTTPPDSSQTTVSNTPALLSTQDLAKGIIANKYGNGINRINELTRLGYSKEQIGDAQKLVNQMLGARRPVRRQVPSRATRTSIDEVIANPSTPVAQPAPASNLYQYNATGGAGTPPPNARIAPVGMSIQDAITHGYAINPMQLRR